MRSFIIAAGLLLGGGVSVIAVIGMLAASTVYNRLHYLSMLTACGAPLIGVTVAFAESFSGNGFKAIFSVVILVLAGSILTHATARTAHLRERGIHTSKNNNRS